MSYIICRKIGPFAYYAKITCNEDCSNCKVEYRGLRNHATKWNDKEMAEEWVGTLKDDYIGEINLEIIEYDERRE